MGIAYFGNKNWKEITRDERYFCCELFQQIKGHEKEFVNWIYNNVVWKPKKEGAGDFDKEILISDSIKEWEVGYEVCFYRDYIYFLENIKEFKGISKELYTSNNKEGKYPAKRTFDLCLFSDSQLIIIEAKAQQGFNTEQLKTMKEDVTELLPNLLKKYNKPQHIIILGLHSSLYSPKENTMEYFHGMLTWKALAEKYRKDEFVRADEIYRK